jgi:hypothetical protein
LDTWYTQEGQVENNRSRKIESKEPEDRKNDDIDIDEDENSIATAGTKGKAWKSIARMRYKGETMGISI